LLVGFLHGVWHLPLMLMTTAYNPAGNRLITVPIFLAVLTGAGVIYAYLRWTSGSIWPVIIAHGTFNAVLGSFCWGGRYARCLSRCLPHRRDRSIYLGWGRGYRICLGQTLPISAVSRVR
jgi:membrane protease YdiL (CAAX protease family)